MRRISGRTHALLAALTMLGFAIGAAPALAVRSDVPSGLTSTLTAAHFQLHYNAATATATYVQQGAADFEEAWSRLVTGGGGSPNAALRGPVNDGDGKVDVYLAAPSTQPTFTGGMVSADSTAPYGAYIFMTPDLARSGFRFRAAHEFMHVLQDAYQGALPFRVGGVLTESTANWAAEWALPDVDPADSNFFDAATAPAPWLPLDCSYGTWPSPGGAARPCGNGYWQWLFIERQVETYGVDFVHGVLERVRTCNPDCSTFPVSDRAYLDAEIKAQSANSQSIGSRFDAYALDVWAPSAWTTTALQTIHSLVGRPAASIWNRSNLGPGYSGGSYVIDHLGTRYLLIRNFDDTAPSGPSDQLQFTTTRPAAAIPAWQYMTRDKGGQVWVRHAGGATVTQPADPSKVREVLIPLSNDSSSDALTFGYALRMTRGTSTPPVNDARIGAVTVALDQTATTDSVYAGGRGDLEAPGCAPIDAGVGNGVWYRFTTPNDGMYTYDTTTADFGTVVALYNGSTFAGCAAFGKFAAAQTRGTVYDVFVGRRAGETGDGTLARLKVTGPPAPPANDLRENARSVALDELAGTDNAGATGSGAQEAPGCSFASSATRGIWYRFSTLADGTYTYDTRDSDFGSVVSLYDAATGTFKGCGGDGRFAGQQHRSETYLVYVGRTSGSGTNARLRVSGPSAPTPTPTPTPSPHPTASPVPTAAPAVTPSPTPPAAIWATARATSRSLTMDRRGTVALKVSCAGDPAEHYSIAVTVSAELKGHRRTLMSGHLKLAGGATSTRKLRVSSANRRLVSRRHRLKVRITVALTARPGVIRITRTTLTLTAKR